MQKKYLKIVGAILVVTGVVITLNLSTRQKMNWGRLMKENVEALTADETNPYYPCVRAKGFCFKGGIKVKVVALVTKE